MSYSFARKALLSLISLSGLALAGAAHAGVCPAIGSSVDCGYVIVYGPGGTVTTYSTNGQSYGPGTIDTTPYDGSDDALIGVINNTGGTLNSIHLTGSGDGGGIFGFEGDGPNQYGQPSYGPTGYEGPNTSFANINATFDAGDVMFTGGLANGQSAWFALEGSPASLDVTAPPAGPSNKVPEPVTIALVMSGLAGMARVRRQRK